MSEYREQAIRDVARTVGIYPELVTRGLSDKTEGDVEDAFGKCRTLLVLLVAQTERVLELEAALRAALPAVEHAHKEAILSPNTPGDWWEWYEELQQVRAALKGKE